MTEQTNLVPKRRFEEFQNTYAWEQRKLGEIAEFNPKSILPNQFEYVDLESVVGTSLITHRTEQKGSAPSRAQRLAKRGDIFYQTVRPYQKNNYLFDLPYEDFVFSTGYAQMRPNVDSYFLLSRIQEEKFTSNVLDRSTGTSYPAINSNDLAQIEIGVPTFPKEQEKIGNFFKQLDNTLALHQRKLEKTKALKSAYLSEMFPAEGEYEPKRRFAGFTQAWEQCKIGEIFKVTRGQVLAATETSENKTDEMPYPVYSSQTKNNGLMGYYKDYLFDTAITWTTDGANAGTVNYRDGKFYSTNVNGVLLSDEGYANKAVAEALNRVAWKYVSRVGNPKLMNNIMSDIVISLPLAIEEQNKISEFFESIDHLIALQQHKLEKLQNIKKAYLNEMFV